MEIQELKDNAVLLRGRHLVTFEDNAASGGSLPHLGGIEYKSDVRDGANSPRDIGGLRKVSPIGSSAKMIKCWGKDNQAPLRLEEAIRANALLPSLLDSKRKILLGQRLYMYYERFENDTKGKMTRIEDEEPMPTEIEDFYLESGEHRYFQQLAGQLVKNGNVITEFLPSENAQISGVKIAALRAHEAKFWRKEEQNTEGVSENAFFQGNAWAAKSKFPIREVAMYSGPTTQTDMPFVYWTGDPMFYPDDYYFSTVFMGSMSWAALMNVVPLFHDNNLKHMYITPLHIRLRKGMFLDKRGYDSAINQTEKQKFLDAESAARAAWLESANKVLAGYENAGRAIWSEEEVLSGMQKQFPDVEIVPLKIELHDDALLKVEEAGRKAVMSSAQIHPTIANIETAGKLSSGSEMGNAVRMQRLIHTPDARKNLLEAWNIAIRLNGWHTKHSRAGRMPKFGFADEEIVQLNQDKTGVQPVN